MKNNLYYTPTIEEFHIGFEYEVMIPEKSVWSKETFFLNNSHIQLVKYINLQDDFTKNKIRVKYLDQSDIESLGWELDQYCSKEFCLNFKYKDWYLNYFISGLKTIEIGRDGYDTGFMGTIKNKSELIKLMQQLNIK